MSIGLKQAAQQAIEAIQDLRGYRPDIDKAIEALRTAIQQAEAKTDEPVAWVVMNGLSKYQVCGAKAPADALCSEMQKRHDLSGSLAAFHVQPLYTHPAPGAPDGVVKDAERYRWLRASTFPKADQYPYRISTKPIRLPIGFDDQSTFDAAIDAAMTAAQAQKGHQ